jgi:hypothetical protein
VNSSRRHYLTAAAVFIAAGWLANAVVMPPSPTRAAPPAIPATALWWNWLGGLRPLGANFAWLQLQGTWALGDVAGSVVLIRLATGFQPESLYFWAGGVRMLAFDLRSRSQLGADDTALRQAASQLLEEARGWHENNPHYWIERAGVELHAFGDVGSAGESYRRAALLPGAPYHAARLHAQLLVRQGRLQEAHDWLRRLQPTLPPDDPRAQAELVGRRIRQLERLLGRPADEPPDEL